jgi:uncharacterized protein YndB with AHSA1/START domain
VKKRIAIVVLLLLASPLIIAATRPDDFRVQRSTTINAPPERVYSQISDFRNWAAWSPYDQLDPAMQRTYSGSANGKGAVYAWEGNDKVGAGRMEIVDANAPTKVTIKLDFLKPFEAHNVAEFTLEPRGADTAVTWAMHGPSPYILKLMGLFVSMDDMIGKDFETGLASLKTVSER